MRDRGCWLCFEEVKDVVVQEQGKKMLCKGQGFSWLGRRRKKKKKTDRRRSEMFVIRDW